MSLAIAAVPLTVALTANAQVEALRREWTIEGAPCAAATGAARPKWPLKMSFSYVAARYSYVSGMAECADIPRRGWRFGTYQVCQFANPGLIQVATSRGSYDFGPLGGHRAAVTVDRGVATCVVGGWFGARRPSD